MWHRAKCYITSISNAWYLIPVPNMNKIIAFVSGISDRHLKAMTKWPQLLKCGTEPNSIAYAFVAHGIQYQGNLSCHLGGMCKDGQTDRLMDGWADGLNPFLYSPITLRQSGE